MATPTTVSLSNIREIMDARLGLEGKDDGKVGFFSLKIRDSIQGSLALVVFSLRNLLLAVKKGDANAINILTNIAYLSSERIFNNESFLTFYKIVSSKDGVGDGLVSLVSQDGKAVCVTEDQIDKKSTDEYGSYHVIRIPEINGFNIVITRFAGVSNYFALFLKDGKVLRKKQIIGGVEYENYPTFIYASRKKSSDNEVGIIDRVIAILTPLYKKYKIEDEITLHLDHNNYEFTHASVLEGENGSVYGALRVELYDKNVITENEDVFVTMDYNQAQAMLFILPPYTDYLEKKAKLSPNNSVTILNPAVFFHNYFTGSLRDIDTLGLKIERAKLNGFSSYFSDKVSDVLRNEDLSNVAIREKVADVAEVLWVATYFAHTCEREYRSGSSFYLPTYFPMIKSATNHVLTHLGKLTKNEKFVVGRPMSPEMRLLYDYSYDISVLFEKLTKVKEVMMSSVYQKRYNIKKSQRSFEKTQDALVEQGAKIMANKKAQDIVGVTKATNLHLGRFTQMPVVKVFTGLFKGIFGLFTGGAAPATTISQTNILQKSVSTVNNVSVSSVSNTLNSVTNNIEIR